MIYLYLFGTCFHFIYVFMIIGNNFTDTKENQDVMICYHNHKQALSYALEGALPVEQTELLHFGCHASTTIRKIIYWRMPQVSSGAQRCAQTRKTAAHTGISPSLHY